ncbi:hypothetical protein V5799_024301 [Amblyomma americanum]|uniref:Uncharacterized protein n=1 Tax=Amblyomma americanum TaxID=6943 RepID=A0AAQ4ECP5_AMBAM
MLQEEGGSFGDRTVQALTRAKAREIAAERFQPTDPQTLVIRRDEANEAPSRGVGGGRRQIVLRAAASLLPISVVFQRSVSDYRLCRSTECSFRLKSHLLHPVTS